ncbi:MAG: FtsX-like permease family protein [Clostridiales bacterium]|nr:FtsX-like permease family protein [Clostridiales bacterium]
MEIKQSFMLAVKSLLSSKMRAILTMLGMIIGVAAVIVIIGLGNGVTAYIEDIFKSMGANVIASVTLYNGNSKKIDINELDNMVYNSQNIAKYSPYVTSNSPTSVKYGTNSHYSTIIGGNEDYGTVRDRGIEQGRFIQYLDVARIQRVCVIGSYVKDKLFEDEENVIGQNIKINGEVFKIVGILESKQEGIAGGEDDIIIIPYTVAQRIFKIEEVTTYYFLATSSEFAGEAEKDITQFWYDTFKDEDDYLIINAESILDQLNDVMSMLTTFLVAIAGISLLVGGIGIMNIMLISVTERTKEIGIRKALGAKRKDIISQFLIESITTSAIGGIIGIILGIIACYIVAGAMDLKFVISITSIIVAVGVSGFIGVIFGYLPANKAAKLNPIDALRYE